jgi:hypothetical protein
MSGRRLAVKDAKRGKLIRILRHWIGYYSRRRGPDSLTKLTSTSLLLRMLFGLQHHRRMDLSSGVITILEKYRRIPCQR